MVQVNDVYAKMTYPSNDYQLLTIMLLTNKHGGHEWNGMQAVKLCTNKILQFLMGGAG